MFPISGSCFKIDAVNVTTEVGREYQRKWQKAKIDKMREEDWVAYEAHLHMRRKTNLKYRKGETGTEHSFIYNRTRRFELKHD